MYCNLNRHCIAIAHDARCKGIKKARQIYLAFEFLVLLNHECFKLLTISKRSQENWLGWYLAKSSGKLAWPRDHIEESVFKLLFISSLNTYILINFFQIPWDLVPSETRDQIEWRGKRLTTYLVHTCFTREIKLCVILSVFLSFCVSYP